MTNITLNTFEHIEHMPLRVYNRAVFSHNLLEDYGQAVMKEYLSSFTQDEQKQIAIMVAFVQVKGADAAYKAATKGLITLYDPEEDLDGE